MSNSKNWKVTQRSINQVKATDFETDLTYNEARKMAKEYNESTEMYIYTAEKVENEKEK